MNAIFALVFLFIVAQLLRRAITNAGAVMAAAKAIEPRPAVHAVTTVRATDGGRFLPTYDEESPSEDARDELATDRELVLAEEEASREIRVDPSTFVRPLPGPAQSRERAVNWTREHDRFHQKYVDRPMEAPVDVHELRDELRDPAALRRAVIAAEILGPPVSLRPR